MESYLINHRAEYCSGCGACVQICPKHCISFVEGDDGFCFPRIREDQCIHCNRCNDVCPYSKQISYYNIIRSFSVKAKNSDAQKKSSSGGCFYGLSRSIIDQGGEVFGAAWEDNFQCVHKGATNCDELASLLGSKYVQSRCDHVFPIIRDKLKSEQTVLFAGTPCQIDGLRNYLGKEHGNLLLVDIACHGVPSNKDFSKCIQWIEKKHGGKLIYLKFRDKDFAGWAHSLTYKIEKNNSIKTYTAAPYKIPYYYFFLYSKNIRKSCYYCPYIGKSRVGDITLSDFWAAESCLAESEIGNGISTVLCNTEKGMKWLEKSAKYLNAKMIDTELALKGNQPFLKAPEVYPHREVILKQVLNDGYMGISHYLKPKELVVTAIKALIPEKTKRMITRIVGCKK